MEFMLYYIEPSGYAPQLGDSDYGRLHILSDYGKWNMLDHRYLLSVGAVLLTDLISKKVQDGTYILAGNVQNQSQQIYGIEPSLLRYR